MEAELLAHLKELRSDNAATGERLRAEQARDEREKADIAATVRVFNSYWEKHRPGEAVPIEVVVPPQASPSAVSQPGTPHLADPLKRSMATAFLQMPARFTTKEFFALVPEINSEDVPGSQGYDFLRRLVELEKLWVLQPGAGRRPTTYSKEPVSSAAAKANGIMVQIAESFAPQLDPATVTPNILGGTS